MVRYLRLIIPICMAIHTAYAQQQQAVIVNDNRIVAQAQAQSQAQFQQQLRGPSTSTIPAASYVDQQQQVVVNNIAPQQQQAQQQLGPSAALPAAATTSSFETQSARQLQLEIAVGNSDQYAESVLTIKQSPKAGIGIGANLHNQVGQLLSMTTEMVQTAKILAQNERTLSEGKNLMVKARGLFSQAVNFIQQQEPTNTNTNTKEQELNDERDLLRKNAPVDNTHYIETAVDDEEGDDERALRITRQLYETMVTFPECLEQLFQDCLDRINSEIAEIGLSTIEVVVHEKRNSDQDGYNKVVIVTNQLADGVKGRVGDGIVTYPFLWDDAVSGPRTLGVDGKWNCQNMTPDECCNSIKQSVPHPDVNDKNIECHIFVPFGGIGNPRRNDRVFITLSPDGRVHEPPIIQ